jgi:hypothetical protein
LSITLYATLLTSQPWWRPRSAHVSDHSARDTLYDEDEDEDVWRLV